MRKHLLLIIYMIALAFTQQGSNTALHLVAVKLQRNSVTHLTAKADHYARFDCYDDSNVCLSELNVEDDEQAKSKPVYAAGLSWLPANISIIANANQLKYTPSFRPVVSTGLFKLNRVFRL